MAWHGMAFGKADDGTRDGIWPLGNSEQGEVDLTMGTGMGMESEHILRAERYQARDKGQRSELKLGVVLKEL